MKQAIILTGKELSLLRRGKKLEISFGGETLLILGKRKAMANARSSRRKK